MISGVRNDWNQPTTSAVDQDQHGGEGDSQVAEDLVGDLPLAVPFHRVAIRIGGQRGHVLLDLVAFRNLDPVDLRPKLQNRVDRALHRAGDVAR